MNSVQIIGNIVRDPEVRYTRTGKAVASFTVAVNRSWVSVQGERKESTDYIPVVAWGRLADLVGQRITKGTRVFVEGRFQTRSYETQEGEKRYMTEVVANLIAPNVEFDSMGTDARGGSFGSQANEQRNDFGGGEPRGDFSQFGNDPKPGAPFDGPDEQIPF